MEDLAANWCRRKNNDGDGRDNTALLMVMKIANDTQYNLLMAFGYISNNYFFFKHT